jgi:hypothetical protein
MIALLLVTAPSPGRAQTCEGDFNGDGMVAINEVITAVVNGLNGCPSPLPTFAPTSTPVPPRTGTPTPTPTATTPTPSATITRTPTLALPREACGGSFFQDNFENPEIPVCAFVGPWNTFCGTNDLVIGWASDGFNILVGIIIEPRIYIAAQAIDRANGRMTGWFTRPDAVDLRPWPGTISMTSETILFNVSPTGGAPFSIAGCPFEAYTGRYLTDLNDFIETSTAGAGASLPAEVQAELREQLRALRRRSEAKGPALALPEAG